MSFSWCLVAFLVIITLPNVVSAQNDIDADYPPVQVSEDPTISNMVRPTCRVFVDAGATQTRILLVQGFDGDSQVIVVDKFPQINQPLDHANPTQVYEEMKPAFMSIVEHLQSAPKPSLLQPRHCRMHLLVSSDLQHRLANGRLDDILKQIHQASIEDANFPFPLARDDMRLVDARAKTYYQMLGVNYLDGRIVASLAPGAVEMSGVLSLHDEAMVIGFDVQERWRRGIRRKQLSRVLNTTDFYLFEHVDYAQARLHLVLARQLFKNYKDIHGKEVAKTATQLPHPCFPVGYKETLIVVGGPPAGIDFDGTGDATHCIGNITEFLAQSNKQCPEGSFCWINSVSQPKPVSPFFASGKFMTSVRYTKDILQYQRQMETDPTVVSELATLELPLPTLAQLRIAAKQFCAISSSDLENSGIKYDGGKSSNDVCFELCQAIALLHKIGVEESEKRVVFGEPLAANSTEALLAQDDSMNRNIVTSHSPSETSWVVGVFLSFQVLERRQSFSLESDEFAVRVSEGVPMGMTLSALLLAVAGAFLYMSTGARPIKSSGYRRVNNSVNGADPAAELTRRSTNAIIFVDDASE